MDHSADTDDQNESFLARGNDVLSQFGPVGENTAFLVDGDVSGGTANGKERKKANWLDIVIELIEEMAKDQRPSYEEDAHEYGNCNIQEAMAECVDLEILGTSGDGRLSWLVDTATAKKNNYLQTKTMSAAMKIRRNKQPDEAAELTETSATTPMKAVGRMKPPRRRWVCVSGPWR